MAGSPDENVDKKDVWDNIRVSSVFAVNIAVAIGLAAQIAGAPSLLNAAWTSEHAIAMAVKTGHLAAGMQALRKHHATHPA